MPRTLAAVLATKQERRRIRSLLHSDQCPPGPTATNAPRRGRKVIRGAVSAALIVAAFGFALPRFASYHSVWASLQTMTWPYALLIGVAAAASLASYWFGICAVLPSLQLREAAVVNLSSNAVANSLPAGGALGMGGSWATLSSWGISTETVRAVHLAVGHLERLREAWPAGPRAGGPADRH